MRSARALAERISVALRAFQAFQLAHPKHARALLRHTNHVHDNRVLDLTILSLYDQKKFRIAT